MKSRLFIILVLLLFWAGFVSSISFMEAWLKFRAEGVTLNVGLSIGKKIFTALNRSEWGFLSLYLLMAFKLFKFKPEPPLLGSLLIFLILFLQTFWILPALNARVEMILDGQTPEKSFLHLYFGTLEILKVGLLLALSFQWYKVALQVNAGPGTMHTKPFSHNAVKINLTGKS